MFLAKSLIFLLSILFCASSCFGFFEFAAGLASYAYGKLSCGNNCCTDNEIPADFEALKEKLRTNVFGQPLVKNTVIQALKSHWNNKIESNKALTISFHGSPGIGKNYVTKFIQEALYSQGMESPHVHNFNARIHFPEVEHVKDYKRDLANWISGNVTKCPKQLFVFDEVHLMPAGVLDAIKPFIDYIDAVDRVSYKKAIFLFLSNTGSSIINSKAFELWNMGIDREHMKLDVFEKLIWQGAFNEKGGFQNSENIRSHLIDHYVPFLPLMKPHVLMCIKREFQKVGVQDPTKKQLEEIMDFVDWDTNSDQVFAKTGCKRLSQKVRAAVA